MSRITFVTGAQHRLRMACQIVSRHYLAGERLMIYVSDAQRLAYVDQMLWSFEKTAFVPHVLAGHARADAAPVVLAQDVAQLVQGGPAVLLNLDHDIVPPSAGAVQILEVVSEHAQDRAAARRRWQQYRAQGHDLSTAPLADYLG